MPPQIKSSTLYVGNLPVDATRAEVEEVFGEAGPIKKCFVLKGELLICPLMYGVFGGHLFGINICSLFCMIVSFPGS